MTDPSGQWFCYSAGADGDRLVVNLATPGSVRTGALELLALGPGARAGALAKSGWFAVTDPTRRFSTVEPGIIWRRGHSAAFSADGRRIAWCTEEGPVVLVDLDAVQRRLTEFDDEVHRRKR